MIRLYLFLFLSFPRRRESLYPFAQAVKEIPAFAGMTNVRMYFLVVFAFFAFTVAAYADEPLSMNAPKPLFQVTYSDAEDAIGRALAEKGAGTKLSASIRGDNKSEPIFSYAKPVNVEIRGLTFDKANNKWAANLFFLSGSDVVTAIPSTGQFEEMVEVPVLRREVHNGDVIKDSDVEVRDFPLSRTRSDIVTDISDLIGKSPMRGISPNRPIRQQEVALPPVIKKNRMVEMRYNAPGMQITTNGQAMDDGAKGDVISVRNTTSRKVVRAVVEDANTVTIISQDSQTSQLTGGDHAAN